MSITPPDTDVNGSPFDPTALLRAVPAEMPDEAVRGFLCDIHRLRAMADALAVEATGVLDRRTIWAGDAARSAGAWLAARVDLTPFQARREADVARSLRTMPHVEAAARSGRLGRVKVDARAQKWALAFRHRGCAFPGCTAPAEWCEAHHIEPFNPTRGTGPTDLDGLILLCRFHHHRVHEGGFKLTRAPDGSIEVRRPDGTLINRCRPRRPSIHPRPLDHPDQEGDPNHPDTQ